MNSTATAASAEAATAAETVMHTGTQHTFSHKEYDRMEWKYAMLFILVICINLPKLSSNEINFRILWLLGSYTSDERRTTTKKTTTVYICISLFSLHFLGTFHDFVVIRVVFCVCSVQEKASGNLQQSIGSFSKMNILMAKNYFRTLKAESSRTSRSAWLASFTSLLLPHLTESFSLSSFPIFFFASFYYFFFFYLFVLHSDWCTLYVLYVYVVGVCNILG